MEYHTHLDLDIRRQLVDLHSILLRALGGAMRGLTTQVADLQAHTKATENRSDEAYRCSTCPEGHSQPGSRLVSDH